MEQAPHNPGEDELQTTPEVAESPEAQRIREGIAEALRDGGTKVRSLSGHGRTSYETNGLTSLAT